MLAQVVLLRQAKPSGRLVVLVQALTAPKLASHDSAHSSVPAPIQVPPHNALISDRPLTSLQGQCGLLCTQCDK